MGLDIVDGDLLITEGDYKIVVRDKDGNLQVIENGTVIVDNGKLVDQNTDIGQLNLKDTLIPK